MPKIKKVSETRTTRKSRPALSPESRLNQLISKAYDLVEERLDDRTATSQETTSLIKLGTEQAKLEAEKLRRENMLLAAKTDAIESSKKTEELYSKAIKAMSEYSGHPEMAEDVELMQE